MRFAAKAVFVIAGLLYSVACGSTLSESGVKPRAGGSYQATLQNGALLSFAVAETRDGKLAGSGQLGSATAGVSFSVNGTVHRDSVHLRMLKENGDSASLRGAFNSFDRIQLVAQFTAFGGYTENHVLVARYQTQSEF